MKTLGLIGGMSWESTVVYYQKLNRLVQYQLGGLHSARILMQSLDFAEVAQLQHQENWEMLANVLTDAARNLESAGADAVLICTNTMHLLAPKVESALRIPLLHIADATGSILTQHGVTTCGLIGTAFTMQKPFYKQRLKEKFFIDTLVPDNDDQQIIHAVIYEELCKGVISETSRQQYVKIIDKLIAQGAEHIILGCTEIGLLIDPSHVSVPVIDTTEAHTRQAVKFALQVRD